MKNSLRFLCLSLLLTCAAAVSAGTPSLDVTVADAAGKVSYKGKTAANGTFATGSLQPGDYAVQFTARAAVSGDYEIALSAGKQKVVSGTVPGTKFGGGGVAMRVKVAKAGNITGQVFSGGNRVAAPAAAGGGKIKIVNGKRYVWVGPETGSHMGGRWVEEGSQMASGVVKGGAGVLSGMQDNAGQGAVPGN